MPIEIKIRLKPPFYIETLNGISNELNLKLDDEQEVNLMVCFMSEVPDKRSYVAEGFLDFNYVGHPNVVSYKRFWFSKNCIYMNLHTTSTDEQILVLEFTFAPNCTTDNTLVPCGRFS